MPDSIPLEKPSVIPHDLLLARTDLLSMIYDAVSSGILLLEPDHKVAFTNQGFCALTCFTQAELVGQPIQTVLAGDYAAPFIRMLDQLWQQDAPQEGEFVLRRKDDSLVHVIGDGRIVSVPGGQHLALINLMDLSHHLQSDHNIYQALFEHNNDAILLIHPSGKILEVNPKTAELLGYSTDDLAGKSLDQALPGESATDLQDQLEVLLEGFSLPPIERTYRHKNGSPVPVEVSLSLVRDKQSNPLHFQAILRDISERKRNEAQQQRLHEFEKSSGEISKFFVTQQDLDSAIEETLQASAKMVQAQRAQIYVLKPDGETLSVLHEWALPGVRVFKEWLVDLETFVFPWWLNQMYDNEVIAISNIEALPNPEREMFETQEVCALIAVPIFTHGMLYGFMVVSELNTPHAWPQDAISYLRSVTEMIGRGLERFEITQTLRERNLELEAARVEISKHAQILEQANAKLVELDGLKSQFLANISHELRTPLNSILGFTQIMIDGWVGALSPEQLDCMKDIDLSSHQLYELISSLLDFAELAAGRIQLASEEVSLSSLIQEVEKDARPQFDEKKISFSVEPNPALPTILADHHRLKQVLANLLNNACKFTPAGGQVSLNCEAIDEEQVLFTVSDTGIGIDPENHEMIFEEFRQVDGSVTREASGAGLGLSISKNLVELHQGRIWVESSAGHGATFNILLPTGNLHQEKEAAPATKTAVILATHPATLETLTRLLSAAGFNPLVEEKDPLVLEKVESLRPDLVILDLGSTEAKDWLLLHMLKQRMADLGTPVYVLSNLPDATLALRRGADVHLAKPVRREEFLLALQRSFASKT